MKKALVLVLSLSFAAPTTPTMHATSSATKMTITGGLLALGAAYGALCCHTETKKQEALNSLFRHYAKQLTSLQEKEAKEPLTPEEIEKKDKIKDKIITLFTKKLDLDFTNKENVDFMMKIIENSRDFYKNLTTILGIGSAAGIAMFLVGICTNIAFAKDMLDEGRERRKNNREFYAWFEQSRRDSQRNHEELIRNITQRNTL